MMINLEAMFLDESMQQRRGNRIALVVALGILSIIVLMLLLI